MALATGGTSIIENGYGQIEINNVSALRDGRIEAQCKLNAEQFSVKAPAQNGMLLMVDKVKKEISFPVDGSKLPLAINYSTEHQYDERKGALKDFCLTPNDVYPRLAYLAKGDLFTTNCVKAASGFDEITVGAEEVYGVPGNDGFIHITNDEGIATAAVILRVVKKTTMPDGQDALQFQVVEA